MSLQNIIGLDAGLDLIYQTRETVFHRDIQTPRVELKIQQSVFDEIRGAWKADETPFLESLIYLLNQNKN